MDLSLFRTLRELRGNARGCVYTEPLWGIPYNLYAPYFSVYMLALGLTDAQIGTITSIGLVFQIFWAMMSGAITDKLGRRRTTLISDFVSWSIPCLIWAVSGNFIHFLIGAIFNSVWRISHTSWTCLLVEDTDPKLLVDVYAWIYIANLVVAFIAPFGGLLIERFSLVPTMRGLLLFSFVMMSIKFIATNAMTTETRQGLARIAETRHQPLTAVLAEYPAVLKQVLLSPALLITTGLLIILSISRMVSGTFWAILATEHLQLPEQYLALFFSASSVIKLLIFFLVMPRLRLANVYGPMLFGFLGVLVSQAILVAIPVGSFGLLALATLIEACTLPVATALLDKLVVLVIDPKERARIMAIIYVIMILFTSPFGWIAGQMSQANRILPFVLNIALYGLGALLTFVAARVVHETGETERQRIEVTG
ncbi:MAG: MFS transporter [Anaerolineae bacterium]|nr:MFS transporter [Anaerolineae bacterium]